MKKVILKKLILGSLTLLFIVMITGTRAKADNVNYYVPSITAQYMCYPYTGFEFEQEWKDDMEAGMQVFHINYENDSDMVIFYYHGGSFISNPLDEHWEFFNLMTEYTDAEIIVPIYPMAYFQSVEDRYAMLLTEYISWKIENPTKRVIFMGDSAGGNLIVGLAGRLRDMELPMPEKLILISPWTDLSESSSIYSENVDAWTQQFFMMTSQIYAGGISRKDGRVSVSYGNLQGLPETMVVAGQLDSLFPDIVSFSDKLESSGVTVYRHYNQYLSHAYPIMYNQFCKTEIRIICEYAID
jgi:acetyl esterase/lipase